MKWLALAASLATCAVVGFAQDPLPEWVLQLSKAKYHLKANFERIPNYVCQETVDRFQRLRRKMDFRKLDTLQLEVAEVGGKEMFARPGGQGFEDSGLSAFHSAGVLSSGDFSSLPTNLFVSDNAQSRPHKAKVPWEPDGWSFDYEIAQFRSGFLIEAQGMKTIVGQRGTFWVDAESLDLIRIEDHAVDVPSMTGMTAIDSTINYARTRIGNAEVLLPRTASLLVENTDGSVMRNEISFSGCREYVTESTLHFGDSVDAAAAAKKK